MTLLYSCCHAVRGRVHVEGVADEADLRALHHGAGVVVDLDRDDADVGSR